MKIIGYRRSSAVKKNLRRVLLALSLLLGSMVVAAFAHPMGNFSISNYSRLRLVPNRVEVLYIIDMAEIPAYQEMPAIDSNQDRSVSEDERESYLDRQVPVWLSQLHLSVDGRPETLRIDHRALSFPPGQGGLPTMRVELQLAAQPGADAIEGRPLIEFSDGNFAERVGWKEIIATGSVGNRILESNVPHQDRSQALRVYPDDLSSPPRVHSARVRFERGEGAALESNETGAGRMGRSQNYLAELVASDRLPIDVILLALIVAVGLGAAHALSPGHGKTVVAAYLVGSRGTAKHAAILGLTVTATHTIGVYALGLITLFASQYILPEKLYPWLGFFSGLTVLLIGVTLFVRRYRLARNRTAHAHDHPHIHPPHPGSTDFSLSHTQAGADSSPHPPHQHMPEGQVTLRSLLALGISGGIVPCPSALVVLLAAISLHRIGFGLILIAAFSFGLAAVLIGIGLLMVYARRFMERFRGDGRVLRVLPVVSAAVIVVLGATIALQSLTTGGIIRWPEAVIFAGLATGTKIMDAVSWATLGLGLLYGIRHALDADHLVAVSTIVTEQKSLRKSSLIGAFWGAGHTTSLLIAGLLVVGLRAAIPARVALSMELMVALMLIVLGISALVRSSRALTVHAHEHDHRDGSHRHMHLHVRETAQHEHVHLFRFGRKPFLIGMVHGLAGSAALTLLVLSTISSLPLALVYILIFGLGSMAGMLVMSNLISLPFLLTSERLGNWNQRIKLVAGLSSVAFGTFLAWNILFVQRLIGQ